MTDPARGSVRHFSLKSGDAFPRHIVGAENVYSSKSSNSPIVVKQRLGINHSAKSFDPGAPMVIDAMANATIVDRGNELMPKSCWILNNYLLNPIVLFDHDYCRPVGASQTVEATDEGLKISAKVGEPGAGHDLTPDQKMVRSLLAQKVLNSLSVGFIPHEWTIDEKTGVLTYVRAELLEISIVSVPMQQNSQISNVKNHTQETQKMADDLTQQTPNPTQPDQPEGSGKPSQDEVLEKVRAMLEDNTNLTKEICETIRKIWPKGEEDQKKLGDLEKENAELKESLSDAKGYIDGLHVRIDKYKALVSAK